MRKIIIQAQNPLDLKEEDIHDYVEEVKKSFTQVEVHFDEGSRMPAGARGVTWWEVVRVFLTDIPNEVKGFVIGKLLELGYEWAKQRFKKNRENKRPKCIVIHGANRQEEGSMVLKSTRHKPTTAEEATKPEPIKRTRKSRKSKKISTKKKKSSKK